MGMWSNINKRENFRDGEEDSTAAYRSRLRDGGNTTGEGDLPDTRTNGSRMPRKEARAMDKVLKQGKQPRKNRRA